VRPNELDGSIADRAQHNRSDAQTQQLKAFHTDVMLQPGEPLPSETDSASSSSTSSTSAATTTPAAADSHHDDGGSGLSGGAIAGIVVGVVAFLAILGALFFYIGRSKTLKETLDRNAATAAPSNSQNPEMQQGGAGMFSPAHNEYRDSNMTAYEHPPQYPYPAKGSPLPHEAGSLRAMSPHPYPGEFPSPGLSELGTPQ
jgi:predicted lipid-binding transport protein (Tim44 family)